MSLDLEWNDKNLFSTTVTDKEAPLKDMIIQYVGEKLSPENEEISVEMIVGILADEFPELVFSLAEENWIRGYEQGLQDDRNLAKMFEE
tara:strand:+ start:5089 stop:5355 length:267 start_codon:yes stop_codon:yes gene_type:complete